MEIGEKLFPLQKKEIKNFTASKKTLTSQNLQLLKTGHLKRVNSLHHGQELGHHGQAEPWHAVVVVDVDLDLVLHLLRQLLLRPVDGWRGQSDAPHVGLSWKMQGMEKNIKLQNGKFLTCFKGGVMRVIHLL